MNYADIVKQKYPNYRLTRVGSGNTYEELEWSVYNPLPNPIPKATLDADLAEFAANEWVGAVGDLLPEQGYELVAIAQLPDSNGLLRKVADKTYKLDTNTYLTSINSTQVINALGYTPYSATNPDNYATVAYVDSVAAAGVRWLAPVELLNLIGGTDTPPATPEHGDAYFIYTGGNTGVWAGFNAGDVVQYQTDTWVLIIPVAEVSVGMRFVIGAVTTTTPAGFAAGKEHQLGTIVSGIGSGSENIVWAWETVADNSAVFIINQNAVGFGRSYLYASDSDEYTLFQVNTIYTAGTGLSLDSTTFNVNRGPGITALADAMTVDIRPNSGLMTTDDGSTPSSATNSQLSLTKTGITPGTYKSVTVDEYGRLTAGTNPTTLAGYGILDAQPLDADLTSIAGLAGTNGLLRKTASNTWALDTATYLPVTVTSPVTGQHIAYNGTNWENQTPVPVIVRAVYTGTIGSVSGTTTHNISSPPAIDTGTQLWSTTITPKTATSEFIVQFSAMTDVSSNNRGVSVALYVNGVFNNGVVHWQDSSKPVTLTVFGKFTATSLSPITISMRTGIAGGGGSWYFASSSNTSRNFNNQGQGVWVITEFVNE